MLCDTIECQLYHMPSSYLHQNWSLDPNKGNVCTDLREDLRNCRANGATWFLWRKQRASMAWMNMNRCRCSLIAAVNQCKLWCDCGSFVLTSTLGRRNDLVPRCPALSYSGGTPAAWASPLCWRWHLGEVCGHKSGECNRTRRLCTRAWGRGTGGGGGLLSLPFSLFLSSSSCCSRRCFSCSSCRCCSSFLFCSSSCCRLAASSSCCCFKKTYET